LKPGRERALLKLRNTSNPQKFWLEYKSGLLKASETVTQIYRKEVTEIRRQAEREVNKAEKRLRNSGPLREEEHRQTLSNHKKALDDIEQTARDRRTNLRNAKWFKCNEKMSKQWFSLNKTKMINATIKSLFETEGTHETEDPKEMSSTARQYHSQLQSEPPMTNQRTDAIDNILSDITVTLKEDQKTSVKKKTKVKEVYDVIKTLPNSKAPGPNGISNKFWKTEMTWRKRAKEKKKQQPVNEDSTPTTVRPCIAALMTRVLQDIDRFGPTGTHFSEARMSLLYKKNDKRDIRNYRPITLLNTDTSGTRIRGLSGPELPSRFTPLKGSAVSSQQSAVIIDADDRHPHGPFCVVSSGRDKFCIYYRIA